MNFPFASRLIFATLLASLITSPPLRAAEKLQFNRDIRPILSDRCFKCHGPDKGSRKAGLRLDLAEEAYAERKKSHKHPIVPGKPEESLIYQKIISTDPDEIMPPPESKLSLSPPEKDKIRQWIAEGGQYQPHWAFISLPDSIAVPKTKNRAWPRNDIDRFILTRLERERLKPSLEADKTRWLRRVTYDLTGLPPSPDEVDEFRADKSSGAYEKVVDRLLASKHFGERMAIPWLDAARYADSYGYQSDQLCPTWPFRDWVVEAFNMNLPYDKFLRDQLAGDLLPKPSRSDRLATAFNRLHRQTNEGGSIEEEWRNEYIADRVHTFGTAFLAMTFECARCHDHKYDPIKQRDYYSLAAFFNSIDEYGLYNDTAHVPTPSLLVPTPEQEKAMAETKSLLVEKRAAMVAAVEKSEAAFQDWLKESSLAPEIPGLIGKFSFDQLDGTNQFVDSFQPTNFSSAIRGNIIVPGHTGQAVQFNGDEEITLPNLAGNLPPWGQYSAIFWLKIPKALSNSVIFHRCQGTDVGFYGTEMDLQQGKLFFVIKRFWPGNAIAIRTLERFPTEEWAQIGVTYDGSALAEGMALYINGNLARTEIVRNHLYKSPENGGSGFSFGALFRSSGLKQGALDDFQVYNRSLSSIEIKQLNDGHSLSDAIKARDASALRSYFVSAFAKPAAEARQELASSVKKYFDARNKVMEISVMEDLAEPRPAYVLARGRYDAPKTDDQRVTRAAPMSLPPHLASNSVLSRLDLAAWLTDPRHPLTARAAVNRFWQMIFGRGLVATPENFGAQGAEPSHPELLDWLARNFINSHWDVKASLKQMVLSATYRQDSKFRPDLQTKDPQNILLARGPSQRLPAEMIRDTALAASGLLDDKSGGPPVSPYMPGDLWRESNSMSPAYHQSVGTDLYRRSLYTVWKRTAPMPDMTAFDSPSREVCTVKRTATVTPQQAFILLNDVQFVEAARVLAEHALAEARSLPDRIRFAFRRLTARDPEPSELTLLEQLFDEQKAIYSQEPERAQKLITAGERKRDNALDPIELAAMTTVSQAILNSDATVWKR